MSVSCCTEKARIQQNKRFLPSFSVQILAISTRTYGEYFGSKLARQNHLSEIEFIHTYSLNIDVECLSFADSGCHLTYLSFLRHLRPCYHSHRPRRSVQGTRNHWSTAPAASVRSSRRIGMLTSGVRREGKCVYIQCELATSVAFSNAASDAGVPASCLVRL